MRNAKPIIILLFFIIIIIFCLFAFSRATLAAYGDSQAKGLIGAIAAGLCQSRSNTGSFNPLSEARDQTRNLMVSSRIR